MTRQYRKPKWWIPTLMMIAMLGGFAALTQDGLPGWANEIGGVTILLVFFGGLAAWLKMDEGALLDEEAREAENEIYQVTEYEPQGSWPSEEDADQGTKSYLLVRSQVSAPRVGRRPPKRSRGEKGRGFAT
jgi:hypothetical protein